MMDVSTTNIAHKFMNDITSLSGSSNNLYGEIVEYLSSEKGVCVLLNLQKINPQTLNCKHDFGKFAISLCLLIAQNYEDDTYDTICEYGIADFSRINQVKVSRKLNFNYKTLIKSMTFKKYSSADCSSIICTQFKDYDKVRISEWDPAKLMIFLLQYLEKLFLNENTYKSVDNDYLIVLTLLGNCKDVLSMLMSKTNHKQGRDLIIFLTFGFRLTLLILAHEEGYQLILDSNVLKIYVDVYKWSYKWDKNNVLCAYSLNILLVIFSRFLNMFTMHSDIVATLDILNYIFDEEIYEEILSTLITINVSYSASRLKMIDLLSCVISNLKYARYFVSHIQSCGSKKHRHCFKDIDIMIHHHNEIFGLNFMLKKANNLRSCYISNVFSILIKLFKDVNEEEVSLSVLSGVTKCGCCCCYPASLLIVNLTSFCKSPSPQLFEKTLKCLERTIILNLGGMKNNKFQLCVMCNSNFNGLAFNQKLDETTCDHSILSEEKEINSEVLSKFDCDIFKKFVTHNVWKKIKFLDCYIMDENLVTFVLKFFQNLSSKGCKSLQVVIYTVCIEVLQKFIDKRTEFSLVRNDLLVLLDSISNTIRVKDICVNFMMLFPFDKLFKLSFVNNCQHQVLKIIKLSIVREISDSLRSKAAHKQSDIFTLEVNINTDEFDFINYNKFNQSVNLLLEESNAYMSKQLSISQKLLEVKNLYEETEEKSEDLAFFLGIETRFIFITDFIQTFCELQLLMSCCQGNQYTDFNIKNIEQHINLVSAFILTNDPINKSSSFFKSCWTLLSSLIYSCFMCCGEDLRTSLLVHLETRVLTSLMPTEEIYSFLSIVSSCCLGKTLLENHAFIKYDVASIGSSEDNSPEDLDNLVDGYEADLEYSDVSPHMEKYLHADNVTLPLKIYPNITVFLFNCINQLANLEDIDGHLHASELQYVIDKILSTVQIHTQEFEDISAELINCILECPLMKLNDGNPLVLGIQRKLMNLFEVVCSIGITNTATKQFFELMLLNQNYDLFLNPLNNLLSIEYVQPHKFITFQHPHGENHNSSTKIVSNEFGKFTIPLDKNWHPFSKGFSLSIWCCNKNDVAPLFCQDIDKMYKLTTLKPDNQLGDKGSNSGIAFKSQYHLLSVTHENICMEVQTTYDGIFIVKLHQMKNDEWSCTSEESIQIAHFSKNLWRHVFLTVKSIKYRSSYQLNVTIHCDLSTTNPVCMTIPMPRFQKSSPLTLSFGHYENVAISQNNKFIPYGIGSILLFKSDVPSHLGHSLYLLGPDYKVGLESESIPITHTHSSVALVTEMSKEASNTLLNVPDLECLPQKYLLGALYPDYPSSLIHYKSPVTMFGILSTSSDEYSKCYLSEYKKIPVSWRQAPVVVSKQPFAQILSQIGGIKMFLYLLATSKTAIERKLSLQCILSGIKSNLSYMGDISSTNVMDMVSYLLEDKKFEWDFQILEVIINSSLDKKLCEYSRSKNTLSLTFSSNAVIIWPNILCLGIKCWKILLELKISESSGCGWEIFLRCLLLLTRESHPLRDINIIQLNKIGSFFKLCDMFKEVLINPVSINIGDIIYGLSFELIDKLFKYPASEDHLKFLINFLLLSLPSEFTHVTYQENSYYQDDIAIYKIGSYSVDQSYPKGYIKFLVEVTKLCSRALLTCPDLTIKYVLKSCIHLEVLIVLLNYPVREVRISVLELIKIWLSRVPQDMLSSLMKNNMFYMTTFQLTRFKLSDEVLNSIMSLCFEFRSTINCDPSLPEGWTPSKLQQKSVVMLLGILPHSVFYPKHCIYLLRWFQLMISVPKLLTNLMNHGIIDSLMKLLHQIVCQGRELMCHAKECLPDMVQHTIGVILLLLNKVPKASLGVLGSLYSIHNILQRMPEAEESSQLFILFSQLIAGFILDLTLLSVTYTCSEKFSPCFSELLSEVEDQSALFKTCAERLKEIELEKLFVFQTDDMKSCGAVLGNILKEILKWGSGFISSSHMVFGSGVFKRLYLKFLLKLSIHAVKNEIMFSVEVKNILSTQLANVCLLLLSQSQTVELRCKCALELKSCEQKSLLFLFMFQNSTEGLSVMWSFVWDLLISNKSNMTGEVYDEIMSLYKELQIQQHGIVVHPSPDDPSEVDMEILKSQVSDYLSKKLQHHSWEPQENDGHLNRWKGLLDVVSGQCLSATQVAVVFQNNTRKSVMMNFKSLLSKKLAAWQNWNVLEGQLGHEKAICFQSESFPLFWELNPCEGPGRVRKRLQRCKLNMDSRFLLPEAKNKTRQKKSALSFVKEVQFEHSALVDKLHYDQQITYMCNASIVTPFTEVLGEVLLGTTALFFVPEKHSTRYSKQDHLDDPGLEPESWLYTEVREVHRRRYKLRNIGVEMFLTCGQTKFLSLDSSTDRDTLVMQLLAKNLTFLKEDDHLEEIKQQWRNQSMTNFDYLTYLNKLSGRTFNDLMQYPVFPFVLGQYETLTLNLKNPKTYRFSIWPKSLYLWQFFYSQEFVYCSNLLKFSDWLWQTMIWFFPENHTQMKDTPFPPLMNPPSPWGRTFHPLLL